MLWSHQHATIPLLWKVGFDPSPPLHYSKGGCEGVSFFTFYPLFDFRRCGDHITCYNLLIKW